MAPTYPIRSPIRNSPRALITYQDWSGVRPAELWPMVFSRVSMFRYREERQKHLRGVDLAGRLPYRYSPGSALTYTTQIELVRGNYQRTLLAVARLASDVEGTVHYEFKLAIGEFRMSRIHVKPVMAQHLLSADALLCIIHKDLGQKIVE